MLTAGILTISDRASQGIYEDQSGAMAREALSRLDDVVVKVTAIVPDEIERIAQTLRTWSDENKLNLIVTTGGTGPAPRDVTPEATLAVIEREVPGIAEFLRMQSLRYTLTAILSRAVAGIRGQTLIVNLPGSPKAVDECLELLMPVIPTAVYLLTDGASGADDRGKSKVRPKQTND